MTAPTSNRFRLACAALAAGAMLVGAAALPLTSAATPSVGELSSELGNAQAREQALAASVRSLSAVIAALSGQVALIERRQAAVQAELDRDRLALAAARAALARQRRRVERLARRLARARAALARELVSSYETDPPDVVTVVLQSHGFADMLDRLDFLRFAKQHEQDVITLTRAAKAAAENAARRLAALEQHDRMITDAVATQARAIASMGDLLRARQAALQSARAARIAALHATHARTDQLRQALSRLQAQLANSSGQSFGSWTIPSAIVMCESGGQNLPPNGAGASGYYQFLPSTWRQLGGSTPAAYLAPKSEQDRLAGELWAGGQGASNWACSGIVGVR